MLLYIVWLFLPVLQNLGGMKVGVIAIGIFGIGLLLDKDYLNSHGLEFYLRVCGAILLPLYAFAALYRGRTLLPFIGQQGMFWFPPIFCIYIRFKNDVRLTRFVAYALLSTIIVTCITTTIGCIAYHDPKNITLARELSMGWIEKTRADMIMRMNIASYDFIYALVLPIPLIFSFIQIEKGWRKIAWIASLPLIMLTLIVADFALAVFAAVAVIAVELLALLLRCLTKKAKHPLSQSMSLLCTMPLLLLVIIFRMELIDMGAWLCEKLNLRDIGDSFKEMKLVFSGNPDQIKNADSRLIFYQYALNGFKDSPFIGMLFQNVTLEPSQNLAQHYQALRISGHSDVLDVLAGMGIFGAVIMPVLIYTVCHGFMKGMRKLQSYAQIILMLCVLFGFCVLTTMVYSREVSVIVFIGALLLMQREEKLGISSVTMD